MTISYTRQLLSNTTFCEIITCSCNRRRTTMRGECQWAFARCKRNFWRLTLYVHCVMYHMYINYPIIIGTLFCPVERTVNTWCLTFVEYHQQSRGWAIVCMLECWHTYFPIVAFLLVNARVWKVVYRLFIWCSPAHKKRTDLFELGNSYNYCTSLLLER